MAAQTIFSNFPPMLKSRNREIKSTHNFGIVACIPTTFLEINENYRVWSLMSIHFIHKTLDCHQALGMENGAICDGQITASSQRDVNHAARQGRLHSNATRKLKGAWSAADNDDKPWLQIYLGSESIIITRVATQGGNGLQQWVTEYNVQYSDDKVNFRYYKEQGAADKKVAYTVHWNADDRLFA